MLLLETTNAAIRILCGALCKVVYRIIAWAYTLFIDVSKFDWLSNVDVQKIYERITLILSIVMVFYVTFEFVKFVVQPEQLTDKEKGASKIVYKMVIVVVLLGFVPTIFSFAYKIQSAIIENEVISKVIIGKSNVDVDKVGRQFSANVLSIFYYYDEENWGEDEECEGTPCKELVDANISELIETGAVPHLNLGINETADDTLAFLSDVKENTPIITFDGILAVLVGGFMAYMLVLYCIDVGVRAVQLLYLQIIAPIPIIGYLSPKKDGIFQKWVKQCTTTYLDLFIRQSIIYFILLICQTLLSSTAFDQYEASRFWVKIALIMGLLLFAHKAPKMLKELFPNSGSASGNFGLKAGERVAPEAARAIGASYAGTRSLARNAIARGADTHKRNKAIKEKLLSEGKDPTRKAMRDARKQNRADYRTSKQDLNNARRNLRSAIKNGTPEEINSMQREYRDKQADFISKQSQVAEDKNLRYRSVAGQAAWGAVSGAARGAKIGLGATKLEDISKKANDAKQADIQSNLRREKYLDSGGTGLADTLKSGVEQRLGIRTDAQNIDREIKSLESKAKTLENISQNEKTLITSNDKAKDNNLKKLSEGKLSNRITSAQNLSFSDGSTFSLRAGETVSDAYGRLDSAMVIAEQELKKATDAGIQADTQSAQENYTRAKIQKEQGAKKLHEISQAQIFDAISAYEADPTNNPNPRENSNFDQGSVSAAYESKWNIENMRRNPTTFNAMKNILGENSPEFQAFCGAVPLTFDAVDKIEKAVKRSTAERTEAITEINNYKQRLSSSSYYDAKKAADENSGGGKK